MRRFQSSMVSDAAFMLLFAACFVAVVFTARDPDLYLQNVIFLNVAFMIAIITYFTTVTTGLILNILFIFGYGTFTLYQTVIVGGLIGPQNYFWLIMTPIFTMVTWMLTLSSKRLQAENEELLRNNSSLATVDANTSLKNTLSFKNDATIFMALSVRYEIPLTLLVIQVKYWDEIKRMISESQLTDAIQDMSRLSQTSIRTNDALYMLNREHPTWGMLLFTDRPGAQIVIDRLKQRVNELNESESEKYKVSLNLKIGAIQYERESIPTPLDFIAQAKKQLEYDV
ncbi:GGDEF domain-containing protein [Paenibacillus pinisoli]|uniref:GGDEF domain-containing protein n=1 Tax=Paenibacillus pinisoli TaxID=1276110 RepID=A0A3A6PP80_9BACL|nr:diguanylate cyclase [Paenibacillus pinisoli]RJX41198.1 GGDEF domain-containing protein [Paenibacillus pinisoli]